MDWVDWSVMVVRVVLVFFVLLIAVLLYIWMERKVIADMQTRVGPMRAGPRGMLVTLADGIKLFFKEGITPTNADRPVYLIAPILAMFPGFLAFCTIPFGEPVELFGRVVPFQITDLNIGILWVLAMTSIGVYGVVLAGWSSGSNYPLLGSVRSSAQMISYEVGMGLALVAVIMWSGHLSMSEIVAQQSGNFALHWHDATLFGVPAWNIFPQFPAFVVFFICALAETNRPPFDLAEAESELVAGFHTEYSGIKFAMFFLGEYVSTVTIAAVGVTLFLGGWHGPWFDGPLSWIGPLLWFLLKITAVIYVMILVRATLPRMRYDRLMQFGWKVLSVRPAVGHGHRARGGDPAGVRQPREVPDVRGHVRHARAGPVARAVVHSSRRAIPQGGGCMTDDRDPRERGGVWDSTVAIAKGMGTVFKQTFRPDNTEQYPKEIASTRSDLTSAATVSTSTRTAWRNASAASCAPTPAPPMRSVEGADNDPEAPTSPGERYAKDYQINYLRCIMCGLCVEACPTRALTLTSYFEMGFTSREEAIWTKEQLLTPPPELGTDPVDREG